MKRYSPCHVQPPHPPPPPFPPLPLPLLPFWFNTQRGEDRLSHAAESFSSHPLQHRDGCFVNTEHKADPIVFLLVLIDHPMADVQSLVQPTKPMKALCILYRAGNQAITLL